MKKIRIFISSPGDVIQERKIAKNIIAELQHIYSRYVELETIMWEDLPLEATGSFQSGIDFFLDQAPIDIAVFILWSRLGSTLGQSYRKKDGSLYASGTEYEFDTMYALWEQTRRPRIIVYVKDAEIQLGKGLSTPQIKDALEQQDKLNSFIEEKFRDRETGTNYAYLQFDRQQTFEERLRTHLTRMIQEHIGHDVNVREWEGNPYVGLKSYDVDESPIFCGRKDLTYDIIEKISEKHRDNQEPTLLILGESGSGKSSLVKAGLIPYFQNTSGEEIKYEAHVISPSEFRGDIYNGLVDRLLSFYPDIADNPVCADLKNGVDDNFKFEYLAYAIQNSNPPARPILILDQFEELFSDNLITEDDRIRTIRLLRGIASTHTVWLIMSMRNDFYSRFTSYPDLGVLKNDALVVDIPNVSASDVLEIIEEPARKANLKWEVNERGLALSKQIAKDAGEIKNLPLIEFALSELYNRCAEDEKLTFEAYAEIGHLKGAVVKYADTFYNGLTAEEKTEFNDLLSQLVTVSSEKEVRFVRKTALKEVAEKNQCCKNLISKLIAAHLLVSGKDTNGNSTISVVHEILLSSWSVIQEWTKNQKHFIVQNDYYEKQARHWDSNGRQNYELIQERSSLLKAEYFVYQNENRLSTLVRDYLRTSLLKKSRKGLAKYCILSLSLLFLFFSSVYLMFVGTTGDTDMDRTIGLGNLMWWDLVIVLIPLLAMSFRATWVRFRPKYTYQTIALTSYLWIGMLVIPFVDFLIEMDRTDALWYILSQIPFILLASTVWIEFWRRKQWKNGKFIPYFMTDKFTAVKNIVLSILVVFFVVFLLGIYVVIISEKNEKLEKAKETATECLDALNNMQDRLSWQDNKYINELRMGYLEKVYEDELADTIPNEYKGKYALCLYNLFEPLEAVQYLCPNSNYQRYLFVAAAMRAGLYDYAEAALELCSESNEYRDYNWLSTVNLIWYSEKIGRFDLAKQFSKTVLANKEEYAQDIAFNINCGHILLMDGDIKGAFDYYEQAVKLGIEQVPGSSEKDVREFVLQNIQNDMDVFHWLNVGQMEKINVVYKNFNLPKREFFTQQSDSLTTNKFVNEMEGDWALTDSSIVMHYYSKSPLCQYREFNRNNDGEMTETVRTMTNIRISQRDEKLYIEEYSPEKDQKSISCGEIVNKSADELSIKIIENGNDSDKGTIRAYHRVSNDN